MTCLTWTLIAGLSSVYSSRLWLLSTASVLLAIGLSALYAASRMKRIVRKNSTIPRLTPEHVITEPMVALKKNSGRIGLLMLGIVLGWSLHAAKQFNHTYVLNDVRVLERQSPNHYLLQTDHHVDFTFKTCSDSQVDWLVGSMLKVLVYEDRGSCASISDKQLGYVVQRDATGKPILKGGI